MKPNSITYVGSAPNMFYHIFFVAHGKKGYIVHCEGEDEPIVGKNSLCPCCMPASLRKEIADTVDAALNNGSIEGKVTWCVSPEWAGRSFGSENLTGKRKPAYQYLYEPFFCSGIFYGPQEIQDEIRKQTNELIRRHGYPAPSCLKTKK